MAHYRSKDQTILVWNQIRRQITRDFDTGIMNRREEALDVLLTRAWMEFKKRQDKGELTKVEGKYEDLVSAIVEDVVPKHALEDGS